MKSLLAGIMVASMIAMAGCSGEIVATRPADVVYERPVAPGVDYVWIGGDWVWSGGSYRWREGHWDHGRAGRQWHDGRWDSHSHGYRWRRGHW